MPKKILIIDYTTHHPEVVSALVEIFSRHRVQLAVTERFAKKFTERGNSNLTAADVLIKSERFSLREWLNRLAPLIAEQDIVIFSTPNKNYLLRQTLQLATAARKVLFVHNVNYFLEREVLDRATFMRLRGNAPAVARQPSYARELFKHWRKQWRLWLQRANFAQLNRYVDCYCFANNGVENYFQRQSGRANTAILPTNARARTATELVACPPYRGSLNIAIVGMISQQRKDYLQVIKALMAAQLRRPIVLSLLGGCPDPAFAQQLIALLQKNNNANLEIRFDPAQQYIPTATLIELLDAVHLLLSPIQPDTAYQFHREVYGVSKVSGSEGDCLAYMRPLLLPQSYRCADYIEPAVVHYADMQHLVAAIDELNDSAALAALYQRLQGVVTNSDYAEFAETFLRALATPGCAKIAADRKSVV